MLEKFGIERNTELNSLSPMDHDFHRAFHYETKVMLTQEELVSLRKHIKHTLTSILGKYPSGGQIGEAILGLSGGQALLLAHLGVENLPNAAVADKIFKQSAIPADNPRKLKTFLAIYWNSFLADAGEKIDLDTLHDDVNTKLSKKVDFSDLIKKQFERNTEIMRRTMEKTKED